MAIITSTVTFRNSSSHPIRFDRLHPGSYFRIVAEPSRNMKRVRDARIYQKDRNGFFSENISNRAGCVLHPEDLVMPIIKERNPHHAN
jgi:hypothetical protein